MRISRTTLAAIGGGMLGALALAVLAPMALWAVQTYVIPGTPTPRAEIVTNIPNRDEALRSCFSGTSAPTSPTPLAGQCWWNTSTAKVRWYTGSVWDDRSPFPAAVAYEDEANVFTDDQTISKASAILGFYETDQGVDLKRMNIRLDGGLLQFQNANDAGSPGTTPMYLTRSGDMALLGTMTSGTVPGARLAPTTACVSGYTAVGEWCYKTTGEFNTIRSATADESSYTTTALTAGFKAVLVRSEAHLLQNATTDDNSVRACAIPGDSAVAYCGPTLVRAVAIANLAEEEDFDSVTEVVRLDSSAQIKTWCEATIVSVTNLSCNWYIEGYLP